MRDVSSRRLAEVVGSDVCELALAGQEGVVGAHVADVGAEGAEVGVVGDVSVILNQHRFHQNGEERTKLTAICPGS